MVLTTKVRFGAAHEIQGCDEYIIFSINHVLGFMFKTWQFIRIKTELPKIFNYNLIKFSK